MTTSRQNLRSYHHIEYIWIPYLNWFKDPAQLLRIRPHLSPFNIISVSNLEGSQKWPWRSSCCRKARGGVARCRCVGPQHSYIPRSAVLGPDDLGWRGMTWDGRMFLIQKMPKPWTFDVFHVFFHDFPISEWTSICKLYKDAHKGTEVLFHSHGNQQGCGFDVRCWATTRARGFCNRLWIWIWPKGGATGQTWLMDAEGLVGHALAKVSMSASVWVQARARISFETCESCCPTIHFGHFWVVST